MSNIVEPERPTSNAEMDQLKDFNFLEREPGVGPEGPPVRNIELPYFSLSNDIFFSSSSFAAKLGNQDLDQILPATPDIPERKAPDQQPMLRFSCHCNNLCAETLYRPLPPGNAIRILEVMPGEHDSPIVCTLHVATLPEAACSYAALSYAWQINMMPEPQPKPIITCNGQAVDVGKNLFDVLCRVRHPTAPQFIWADALCINQDDVEERSSQVAKMGEIFQSAHEVIVWLGLENGSTWWRQFSAAAAMSDLCTIVNIWRANSGRETQIPEARFYHQPPCDQRQVAVVSPASNRTKRDGYSRHWWLETLDLFSRRWFHRVWVIQEVALARLARVFLGEYEISWEVIGLAASILRTNFDNLVPTITHRGTRKTLLGLRTGVLNAYFMYRLSCSQTHRERMKPDFHQLLILTRSFDCQDSRDRIYGLLGLPFFRLVRSADSDNTPFIVPDYSKSAAEVYLEVSQKILLESRSLRLLSSIQRPFPCNRPEKYGTFDPSISSWIPQWNFSATQSLTPFPVETEPSSAAPLELALTRDPPTLHVRGTIITTVTALSSLGRRADFCIPWWVFEKYSGVIVSGWHKGQSAFLPVDSEGEITDEMLSRNLAPEHLTKVAMVLTGGNDWHGRPVADAAAHRADFARLLMDGGLPWALEDDVFGTEEEVEEEEGFRTKYAYQKALSEEQVEFLKGTLEGLALGGNATRFLDATGAVGRGRRRFRTESGLAGIGPGVMEVGDDVCVLQGASAPFVLRHGDKGYEVIGECYLYVPGRKENESVQEALLREGGREETWLGLV